MCVSVSSVGLLLIISQTKRHPKTEMQIKPIDGTKIFLGRVAPPPWVSSIGGLPHLNFFLIFFVLSVLGVFFEIFFSDFCFIC